MMTIHAQIAPISVLLPTHNAGVHLNPAVKSILNQTYKNFELLIIDDHSSDGSVSQLNHSDRRLKIINNSGEGIVSALNTGVENARYPFIARMDADDIALPDRLESQLAFLKANPRVQICGAQVEIFREDAQIGGGYSNYQDWINKLLSPQDIADNMFVESPIPHPTALMRKQDLLDLGGYRDVEWPEDYDLWLRAHVNHYKFGKPYGVLLKWRDHDQRLSRRSKRYNKKSFFKAKAYYLRLCYPHRHFRIWGSGPTGALLHDELVNNGGTVTDFIDIAEKRIGQFKRHKPICSAYEIRKSNDLILVAVSARGARVEIIEFLSKKEFKLGIDYLCLA